MAENYINSNGLLEDKNGQRLEVVDKAARDQASKNTVRIGELSEEIGQQLYIESINLFDASKQTEETISPHYWVNGAPYGNESLDKTYHCTSIVPVNENTQYTLGIVPSISWGTIQDRVKPWGNAAQGVFFFDDNGAYISATSDNVFTTPAGAKSLRFNFNLIFDNLAANLERIIGAVMLVKGSALPVSYSAYGKTPMKDRVSALEAAKTNFTVRYRARQSYGEIVVASRYSTEKDLMVTLKKKGSNSIFDFYKFDLVSRDSGIEQNINSPLQNVNLMTTATDWHAPFQVKAITNADGDHQDDIHFTGGAHDYTNTGSGGTPTGRTETAKFFADGREVFDESGYCNLLEVIWINYVQATNTKKADGTGREVLVERHRMTFDGREWRSQTELQPLEDVEMVLYYGYQATGGGTLYNRARYYGGVNRLEYDTTTDNISCGNKDATAIRWHGDEHEVILSVDPTFDVGNREFYNGTAALFTSSYGKAYCNFFTNKQMQAGEIYSMRGSYIFRPYIGD